MTTVKKGNFWKTLKLASLMVFFALITDSCTPSHQHGNTDMEDENGSGKKESCVYRNAFDKSKALIKYYGKYTYKGDYRDTNRNIKDIIIRPSVYEPSSNMLPSFSFSVVMLSGGSPHYDVDNLGYKGLQLKGENAQFNNADNESTIEFIFYITIDNIDFNAHEYGIAFSYPEAGYMDVSHSENDHGQSEEYRVTVCDISFVTPITIKETNDVILDYISKKKENFPFTPGDPYPEDWPKFEVIEKEEGYLLIPYFPEDFEKQ